jgi:hypothetical protein
MSYLKKLEEKFIVINKKHIDELPIHTKEMIYNKLDDILHYLPDKKYVVCNQDEIYAESIAEIIIKGEILKAAIKKDFKQLKYEGENNQISGIEEICENIKAREI